MTIPSVMSTCPRLQPLRSACATPWPCCPLAALRYCSPRADRGRWRPLSSGKNLASYKRDTATPLDLNLEAKREEVCIPLAHADGPLVPLREGDTPGSAPRTCERELVVRCGANASSSSCAAAVGSQQAAAAAAGGPLRWRHGRLAAAPQPDGTRRAAPTRLCTGSPLVRGSRLVASASWQAHAGAATGYQPATASFSLRGASAVACHAHAAADCGVGGSGEPAIHEQGIGDCDAASCGPMHAAGAASSSALSRVAAEPAQNAVPKRRKAAPKSGHSTTQGSGDSCAPGGSHIAIEHAGGCGGVSARTHADGSGGSNQCEARGSSAADDGPPTSSHAEPQPVGTLRYRLTSLRGSSALRLAFPQQTLAAANAQDAKYAQQIVPLYGRLPNGQLQDYAVSLRRISSTAQSFIVHRTSLLARDLGLREGDLLALSRMPDGRAVVERAGVGDLPAPPTRRTGDHNTLYLWGGRGGLSASLYGMRAIRQHFPAELEAALRGGTAQHVRVYGRLPSGELRPYDLSLRCARRARYARLHRIQRLAGDLGLQHGDTARLSTLPDGRVEVQLAEPPTAVVQAVGAEAPPASRVRRPSDCNTLLVHHKALCGMPAIRQHYPAQLAAALQSGNIQPVRVYGRLPNGVLHPYDLSLSCSKGSQNARLYGVSRLVGDLGLQHDDALRVWAVPDTTMVAVEPAAPARDANQDAVVLTECSIRIGRAGVPIRLAARMVGNEQAARVTGREGFPLQLEGGGEKLGVLRSRATGKGCKQWQAERLRAWLCAQGAKPGDSLLFEVHAPAATADSVAGEEQSAAAQAQAESGRCVATVRLVRSSVEGPVQGEPGPRCR